MSATKQDKGGKRPIALADHHHPLVAAADRAPLLEKELRERQDDKSSKLRMCVLSLAAEPKSRSSIQLSGA